MINSCHVVSVADSSKTLFTAQQNLATILRLIFLAAAASSSPLPRQLALSAEVPPNRLTHLMAQNQNQNLIISRTKISAEVPPDRLT